MKNDIKELYKTVILEHNKKPFHYEKRINVDHTLLAYNPVCGDKFKIYLVLDNDKIANIHFHGYGCAISKASTSILTQYLLGKTLTEAQELCTTFLNGITTGLSLENPDFKAFAAAKDFPGRAKCATLSWEEVSDFLKTKEI